MLIIVFYPLVLAGEGKLVRNESFAVLEIKTALSHYFVGLRPRALPV